MTENINISEHFQKPFWRRRVNADTQVPPPANATFYVQNALPTTGEHFRDMTNADFLNEICAGAHEINSMYWSSKPVKVVEPVYDAHGNPVLNEKGEQKTQTRIVLEDMETTRCSLPQRFAIAKASHAAANGFWLGNSSKKYKEIFPNMLDWKDSSGMDTALFEVVLSLTHCCDAAWYQYVEGNMITYKVFSYLYGDELFHDFDEERRPRVWRRYSLKGKVAVDVISAGSGGYQTWVQDDLTESEAKDAKSWWQKVKSWFKNADKVLSEDGWRRIAKSDSQIGNNLCQCVYFRVDDIPSGCVADEIASWERLASYVAESMKDSAFPDKFVKSTKIKNLPNPAAHGHIYAVESGDVDVLKASDMKTISAGDMSNIATTTLKTKTDAIMHGSMSVIIEPEILKSGADSSSALRLMFTSEIQWAQAFWIKIVPQVRYAVEVFKALVAKVEGNGDYTKIRTSVEQRIWVPQNISENVDNTTKLVYAGILSKKDGASEVDLQYPGSEEQIRKEQEEELYRKTFIPLKAKAEAQQKYGITDTANDVIVTEKDDNPNKPDTGKPRIDNNASRRDIAE